MIRMCVRPCRTGQPTRSSVLWCAPSTNANAFCDNSTRAFTNTSCGKDQPTMANGLASGPMKASAPSTVSNITPNAPNPQAPINDIDTGTLKPSVNGGEQRLGVNKAQRFLNWSRVMVFRGEPLVDGSIGSANQARNESIWWIL